MNPNSRRMEYGVESDVLEESKVLYEALRVGMLKIEGLEIQEVGYF